MQGLQPIQGYSRKMGQQCCALGVLALRSSLSTQQVVGATLQSLGWQCWVVLLHQCRCFEGSLTAAGCLLRACAASSPPARQMCWGDCCTLTVQHSSSADQGWSPGDPLAAAVPIATQAGTGAAATCQLPMFPCVLILAGQHRCQWHAQGHTPGAVLAPDWAWSSSQQQLCCNTSPVSLWEHTAGAWHGCSMLASFEGFPWPCVSSSAPGRMLLAALADMHTCPLPAACNIGTIQHDTPVLSECGMARQCAARHPCLMRGHACHAVQGGMQPSRVAVVQFVSLPVEEED